MSSDTRYSRVPKNELKLEDCYQEEGEREFERKWPPSLSKALGHCHSVNRALIREKTRQDRTIDRQWVWIKVLGGTAAAEWTALIALLLFVLKNHR